MPNHVTNIVSIKARLDEDELNYDEEQGKLISLYKKLHSKESDFDFNAILPQPKGIYLGSLSEEDQVKYPINWYDWNIANWGTKWNAYQVVYLNRVYDEDDKDKLWLADILVKFETAWDVPTPVLSKLAEEFDVEFTWNNEGEDVWHEWQKLTTREDK